MSKISSSSSKGKQFGPPFDQTLWWLCASFDGAPNQILDHPMKSTMQSSNSELYLVQRIRKHPISTIQGFLSSYRIPGSKVELFSRTIVDAAGPFAVKVKRSMVKRYIIVYSCLIYHALHLEVVDDLLLRDS